MQTYSHLIYTTALLNYLQSRRQAVSTNWLLLGAAAPDVPLALLSLGYVIQRRWFDNESSDPFDGDYDHNYFHNPIWITGHNLMHAPLLLIFYMLLGYVALRLGRPWGYHLTWFAIGCAFHSLLDIPTHHNDGPLLLFPFDWQTRYLSPVSYWQPDYWGGVISRWEHLTDGGLLIIFAVMWLRRRRVNEKGEPAV